VKARIWTERNQGPSWARVTVLRIWRYKAVRGAVTCHGIALSWPDAMAAVDRHLRGVS